MPESALDLAHRQAQVQPKLRLHCSYRLLGTKTPRTLHYSGKVIFSLEGPVTSLDIYRLSSWRLRLLVSRTTDEQHTSGWAVPAIEMWMSGWDRSKIYICVDDRRWNIATAVGHPEPHTRREPIGDLASVSRFAVVTHELPDGLRRPTLLRPRPRSPLVSTLTFILQSDNGCLSWSLGHCGFATFYYPSHLF